MSEPPHESSTCVESKAAQTSASWLSEGPSQRQIVPQAAPSFGQPRPISRLGRAGTQAMSALVSTWELHHHGGERPLVEEVEEEVEQHPYRDQQGSLGIEFGHGRRATMMWAERHSRRVKKRCPERQLS